MNRLFDGLYLIGILDNRNLSHFPNGLYSITTVNKQYGTVSPQNQGTVTPGKS